MKKPYCPECKTLLKLYELDYTFECPNESCGLQFGLECEDEMSQIVWKDFDKSGEQGEIDSVNGEARCR